jgi:hypothetical protein
LGAQPAPDTISLIFPQKLPRGVTITSAKRIQANRQNALKSTGPKTQQGKGIARLNSTKHGLLSQEVLLPGEDADAFAQLDERLRAELQPVGELENLLVEQIIAAYWRLSRLRRVEVGIFTWEHYEELVEQARQEARSYEQDAKWAELLRQINIEITDEDKQKHKEALSRAKEMKAKQGTETATLGRSFIRDADKANAFSKLSRYEAAIERRLYKALHELQRLQAARRADTNVPPPAILDVDVSGVSREAL